MQNIGENQVSRNTIMYDYLGIIFGSAMLFLGAFMFFKPEQSTKKEMRDSKEAVAKIKKNGLIVMFCGVIAVTVGVLILVL